MSQTVEMNLSHLTELLRMSKSLVFVPDRATAKIVRKACHALGLHHWMGVEGDDMGRLPAFERDKENFATICVLPCFTKGWHSLADQVIWIGPLPEATDHQGEKVFAEAMDRIARQHTAHILENWGRPS